MSGIGVKHHKHLRKRILKEGGDFPSKDPSILWMDRAVIIMSIVSPLMTLPQVWNVWVHQDITGISLITWGTYTVGSSVWLMYGILHKEARIILLNVLFVIFNGMVVAGTIVQT